MIEEIDKTYKKIENKILNHEIYQNVKEINHNDTIGILICRKENKFVIEYCSDDRIAVREYELV